MPCVITRRPSCWPPASTCVRWPADSGTAAGESPRCGPTPRGSSRPIVGPRRRSPRGGGFVGVHGAADTEYDWPWYGRLVGAYLRGHPEPQTARVRVENPKHPSTAHLGETWTRFDEW